MNRHFPALFGLCLIASSSLAAKPNVLFIAIDDLRPELGCYGSKEVVSPNIDSFAKTAVTFDRAYCQVAVCNPSRVSLMTGLRPDTTKVWDLITRFRETTPEAVTIPQHFRKHGYHAVSFGKIFHNPWPDNQSWSEPHEWPKGAQLWSPEARKRLGEFREQMRKAGKREAAIRRMRAQATEIVDIPDDQHTDGAIAKQALKAMRRLADRDEPFFLAAGFVRPHLPFVVPRNYWELYERDKITLAPNQFIPKNSPVFAMNTMYELRDYWDYAKAPDPRNGTLSEDEQRTLKHGYLASVSLIDAQVGRLLDELGKLGLADNTIVVLWSDHGWKLGDHNSWCKQSNYEIDARVPLIIRAPGAQKGTKTKGLVELLDIYPTLCDLAGLPVPKQLAGKSLKPILNNSKASVKLAAFNQYKRRERSRELMGYAMRTDRYRYIEWLDRSDSKTVARELYDHRSDSMENENIAGLSRNAGLLDELGTELWSQLKRPEPRGQMRPRLSIHNHSRQALEIYWDRPDGAPRKITVLPIGKRHTINTTIGHRFLIKGTITDYQTKVTVDRQNQSFTIRAGKGPLIPKKKKKARKPSERTNIVFLMADDWSYPHAGILGDPVVKTPNFDSIARDGVLFENAFVSTPSCTPSRLSILTGQHHWRLKEGDSLGGSLREEYPVYTELLQEAGYKIGRYGKGVWPSKHTFRKRDSFGPRFGSFDEFADSLKDKESFCFWFGGQDPHRPYELGIGKRSGIDVDSIKPPACLPNMPVVRSDVADYYWEVQRFDRQIGEVLDRLTEMGELDNTVIVVSGDNGMPFPRCKATLYDMGTRVPLAIRWGKAVRGGRRVNDFVSLCDLAPTFLELTDIDIPSQMTGKSLLSLLKSGRAGQVEPYRTFVLTGMEQHVYPYPARAIRTKDYLYLRRFEPAKWRTGEVSGRNPRYEFAKTPWPTEPGAFSFNIDPGPSKQFLRLNRDRPATERLAELSFTTGETEELYDLKSDPDQLENVASEYRKTLMELRKKLARELRTQGDPRFK
ncbi:MAG: hypothetical protein CMO80_21500 [Verrucomicrobiales bacterium]|nr:hypothetical protein [Verrucomicrobiales bacterium]|tara:strand:+ start:12397 stop:15459 length:3063 start_codon:yes stop_codon:yes gene_type:complete